MLTRHLLCGSDSDSGEVTRYLGQNSIPALLREQSSPNERQEGVEHIRQDMRSILGLDNSAPFPLMSARHLNRLTTDISAELPSDREVMKYVGPAMMQTCFGPATTSVGLTAANLSPGCSGPTRRSRNRSGAS